MSSGQQPNANLGQSVKPPVTRVAVGDDPLATGAITQIQNTSSIRHHQNAIPAPPPSPIGAVAAGVAHNPTTVSVAAKTTTGKNNPTTSSPSPVPVRSGGGETSISPSSKSLDGLADDFLSSKPPPILLSPNPLPRGEAGIVRLRTLVERRAWGDVLKLASTLLSNNGSNSTSSSSKSSSSKSREYSKVYDSLLLKKDEHEQEQQNNNNNDDDTDNDNDNDVPPNIRQETVEIMILQCNAWLMLRRYADLSKEVERWNFLTQNVTTAKSPEWIPWSIRKFVLLVHVLCISLRHIAFVNCVSTMLTTLLKLCICCIFICICITEIDILAGQSCEYNPDNRESSIDILCRLRVRIPSTEFGWLASVDNALTNIYIQRGEWRLAIGSLDRVFDLIPDATQAEVQSLLTSSNDIKPDPENTKMITSILMKTYMCEILSRQGRILLQAGAVFEAGELFEDAKTIWSEVESSSLTILLPEELSYHNESLKVATPSLLEVNEGLFYFAKSNYDHALQSFSKAINILRKDGSSSNFRSKYRIGDWIGPVIAGCQTPTKLYNEAVNNMTLCHLYMCNMKDAVVSLEGLVRDDPAAFLTERVAFNLCTLYELGSDSAVATRNKRVLQLIAKRFFLHDIGPESFRVT
ncbi:MAG: tetratricopeptide (TPR) repeat protein [Bacillariaceae sp.]|jgi:tetratricopeptide (TPR) repeat protein